MNINRLSLRKMGKEAGVSAGFIQYLLKGNDTQINDDYFHKVSTLTNYKGIVTELNKDTNALDQMIMEREIELKLLKELRGDL